MFSVRQVSSPSSGPLLIPWRGGWKYLLPNFQNRNFVVMTATRVQSKLELCLRGTKAPKACERNRSPRDRSKSFFIRKYSFGKERQEWKCAFSVITMADSYCHAISCPLDCHTLYYLPTVITTGITLQRMVRNADPSIIFASFVDRQGCFADCRDRFSILDLEQTIDRPCRLFRKGCCVPLEPSGVGGFCHYNNYQYG